jgi:superfamily II DNA helicase RecQ
MSYIDTIQTYHPLTFEHIIRTAKENVPFELKSRPWQCPGLNHGTARLENEEQLCCYLAAYGEMHKGKLECAISQFPFKNIDTNYEIIDWGCGQGIASVFMIDQLRRNGQIGKLQKVTLVEPSKTALDRAKLNVSLAVGEDVYVEALNNYLPPVDKSFTGEYLTGLHVEEQICIHLFSNILDIPEIDLKDLALMVGSTGYRHYFVCVGPLNFGNERIDSFLRYFDIKGNYFVNVKIGQYRQLPSGKWYGCVAKGFQVVREEGKPFLVPLSYYPPKQFFGAYRLDAIGDFDSKDKNAEKFWKRMSSFEVLAPFDIGASIYEDIDPILAVLSNIITRGLPTKCSPFVEKAMNRVITFSNELEKYGTILFPCADSSILKGNEKILRNTPIGIARIQKVIIEAALTGHISIEQNEWNVLVKENDVPCAALAFADLEMMYNHLTELSKDYDGRKFPKVNLTILSPEYYGSDLHLGNKTYKASKQIDKSTVYDMVIDFGIDEFVDAENVQFSEFKAKNNCYFNVRSSRFVYSSREVYTTDRITYKPVTVIGQSGGHEEIKDTTQHLVYFLQMLFRKKEFRPGQLPILNRALQNKGVIGLLPTGGGKSLTYQLAAMLQPGITVVIDPLKSLMQDQYDGLISNGIDCCTFINSELSPEEKTQHELLMESSQAIITFMSPERLCIYEFRERLQNMHELNVYFSYGVIDEVHCVSEWGQDFRFSYLHLGRNLYSYVRAKEGAISLFGLTATASFDVLSDVERELTGNGAFSLDPDAIVRYENSNRLELQYKIERIEVEYQKDPKYDPTGQLANFGPAVLIGDRKTTNDQKSKFLVDYIDKVPGYIRELQSEESVQRILDRFKERENLEGLDGSQLTVNMPDNYYYRKASYEQSGIIFCPHVNTTGISVSVVSERLSEKCDIGSFSGSAQEGQEQGNESMEFMKRFRDNELPIMVATKAFGMGIDKPNVRFTVNMNYSSSLESFVQEAGRAGRDRKMALSVILMSDYHLARISNRCSKVGTPWTIIRGKWFRENDLMEILEAYNAQIDEQYIDRCNPLSDIVRVKCNTDNKDAQGVRQAWTCNHCSKYNDCVLRYVDWNHRGFLYYKDLQEYLKSIKVRIPKENLEYQGSDYNTVMFFFDNNFKGEYEEKKKMYYLWSEMDLVYFIGNDKKDKPNAHIPAKGFLDVVLNSKPGTEVVTLISYVDDSYADIAKAIYRMCVIGLIDDFTQDYSTRTFRILSTRKPNGSYFNRLKDFLMRYYSEERAENEVEKASVRKGQNEIHKCLGYLTEFIYDKVALKRKRAIDDMRNFCLVGIDDTKDWKEINEDLKDEIYYYFNSKYAREGYKTDNDEEFSLLDETDRGRVSSFDILYKYMRVVDSDVIGVSGSPKDNIKHLQGAVRLIRRGTTDTNAALCFLNVYCLLALKVGSNKNMREELESSFIEGYLAFKEQEKNDDSFYKGIAKFKSELNAKGRNIASIEDFKRFEELELQAELTGHLNWVNTFSSNYTK